MITLSDTVYLVILWSVTGLAVVSGQCTTERCGDDDDPYTLVLEDMKLQSTENGMFSL